MLSKYIFAVIGAASLFIGCASHKAKEAEGQSGQEAVFSTMKPGALLDLSYEAPKDLRPADYGTVKLSFFDSYNEGTLRLKAHTDEGLRLVSEVTEKEFSLAGNAPHDWELDVTAMQDGIYYLNIVATVDLPNGQNTGRAFSVRIEVGDINSENAFKSVTPNGTLSSDGVTVNLPAEEVIR